jgi:parallel beta-helix repeat protein
MSGPRRTAIRILGLAACVDATAATYYVDFDSGSDTNAGTTEQAPWKRAPGDPEADGNPGSRAPQPGDTVLFKGGVVYRGEIIFRQGGAADAPITYKGDGWGVGKALLEGSEPWAAAWTPCILPGDCRGNTNFARIYYAPAPAGYGDFLTALYENGDFLWYAQDPNPDDPLYHDEIDDFFVVPDNSPAIWQTTTTVTDPRVLTQSSSSHWDGAYVAAWVNGNVVDIKKVTAFNPATHTLTHEELSNTPYSDRDGRYSLLNHVALIDRPGEYAHDPASGRIYLRPRNGQNPAGNHYAAYARGMAVFAVQPVSCLTIEGFRIERFTMGIKIENEAGSNIVVRNNDLRTFRSDGWYAIHVSPRDSRVEGNTILDANRAVGILGGSVNLTILSNRVERASRQGIWLMGAADSRILDNTVVDIKGSHANAISVYSGSRNVLVAGNRVLDANSPITFEHGENLSFINNLVVPAWTGYNINDWGGCGGTIVFHNNTLPDSMLGLHSAGAHLLAGVSVAIRSLQRLASPDQFRARRGGRALDARYGGALRPEVLSAEGRSAVDPPRPP